MEPKEKTYLCIDLKSFYASVECADRGLDPFATNLVVADPERGRNTICLAVTPAMKALGVRNRCRVFEIPNGIEYRMAVPRMQRYLEVSAQIYAIYLRHVSAQDIHVYSIDECFIDATPYLTLYHASAQEFARMLMGEVRQETHICATAGIGTNLFLCKLALDITAKHSYDNIGFLDEDAFMRQMWFHRPLTDVWGIGKGIARRLAARGIIDLAGVAAEDESALYREFGVNAEYLIDHAWGQEPCTIQQIHDYRPQGRSLGNGQVLPCDYTYEEARTVMREMVDASVLELTKKGLVAEGIALYVGYARAGEAKTGGASPLAGCREPAGFDRSHGRRRPRGGFAHAGASRKLDRASGSERYLMARFEELFAETVLPGIPIRRINVVFTGLLPQSRATATLFDDVKADAEEMRLQQAVTAIRERFGKNALLRATSLQEKATARERNRQIGGHRA